MSATLVFVAMRKAALLVPTCVCLLGGSSVEGSEYPLLPLHYRVQLADIIVVARVVDPERAMVRVEQLVKGDVSAKTLVLVAYVDGFSAPSDRKPLVADGRELIFLTRNGDEVHAAPVAVRAVDGDE